MVAIAHAQRIEVPDKERVQIALAESHQNYTWVLEDIIISSTALWTKAQTSIGTACTRALWHKATQNHVQLKCTIRNLDQRSMHYYTVKCLPLP